MMNKPLLSVCIITYNHEEYIGQAIEGALMQQCSFPIEIIVGHDYSTDRTGLICREYEEKYPNVKVVTPDKNIGMSRNFVLTSGACSGKYIATLEGDDYWTDPHKLQKQVDFLEKNPDFILCFHDRNCLENGIIIPKLLYDYTGEKHFEGVDVFECNLHALTVVFRNIFKEHPYPAQFYDLPLYDFSLWSYLSLFGKSAYLNFIGATYRLHSNGVFTGNKAVNNYLKVIYCLKHTMSYFPQNYRDKFKYYMLVLNFMVTEDLRTGNETTKYLYHLLKLSVRSVAFNQYEYVKYYYSFYKTNLKKAVKKQLFHFSNSISGSV